LQSASALRSTAPTAQTQPAELLRDFGPLSDTQGWVLLGEQLYLASNSGAAWKPITPALPGGAIIHAVNFIETMRIEILWSEYQADGSLVLQLESSSDQGLHWNHSIVQTLLPDDPAANVANASMTWLDGNTGWIAVKQHTGSNFSSGILFRTVDGGQTWQRLPLPIGEAVHFVDSRVGWLAGGPAGDQLYQTLDGGITWKKQSLPAGIPNDQVNSVYPPVFDSPEKGLLAVVTRSGQDFQLEIYSTRDAGGNWLPVSSLPLGSLAGWPPLSPLQGGNLVAAVPNSNRILRLVNGKEQTVINGDGMSADIVELKMRTTASGWAKWNTSSCTAQAGLEGALNGSCSATTRLIATRDGGVTWQTLDLPGTVSGVLSQHSRSSSTSLAQAQALNAGKTMVFEGQGFDVCTIPSLSQLQSWWNSSPYKTVNLYIGGSARACANTALNADYVAQMRQQGWAFIPTWVGPQAPCTSFTSRFSYDNAYIEGRDEAYHASLHLAELGLSLTSDPWSGGSVVYYDMEIYGSDPACRQAVKEFVNGWVEHMHDLGNLAGVYGATGLLTSSGCTSGLADYLAIPNIPDVIWPARWYHAAGVGTYDPNASVWDTGNCIPPSAWNNHQRILQYAGDHAETWGGTTLSRIDSDVLDGVVAVPYLIGQPSAAFYTSPLTGTTCLTVTFVIPNTAFNTSCNWEYGDGQTGSSCAYMHTHTYSNPGRYTVSLTASNPLRAEGVTLSDSILVNPCLVYLPVILR
jgi:hypothetical protein